MHMAEASLDSLMHTTSTPSFGPCCFLKDSLLLSASGAFLKACTLKQGSRILAADGEPTLVVDIKFHLCPECEVVELQVVGVPPLKVTASHRIVVGTPEGACSTLPAGQLCRGSWVVMSGGQLQELVCVNKSIGRDVEVVEIIFNPDRPVESFFAPFRNILSMGRPVPNQLPPSTNIWRPRTRRGGMWRRQSQQVVQPPLQQLHGEIQHVDSESDLPSWPGTHDPFS
mmetsp:Transcript_107754/g.270978  ORF Transcript_107754/g.270978 Transcript_107754/m.270978 type:complete len:227 (-) Transcript_107754:193-873(-)